MRFEWNESKNAINIDKHGIDFEDVVSMFNQPMRISEKIMVSLVGSVSASSSI